MFWWAGLVVDRFLLNPGSKPAVAESPVDFKAIEEIAISVLGFYVLIDGVAEGAYYWGKLDFFYNYVGMQRFADHLIPKTEFAGIAAAVTRILLGTALIFLSRGIVSLRRRILSFRG